MSDQSEVEVVSWTKFTLVMSIVFAMLMYLRGYFDRPERLRRLKRPNLYKIRSTDRLSNLCPIPEDQTLNHTHSHTASSRNNDLCRRRCA